MFFLIKKGEYMTDYYKILGVSEDADAAVKANLFLKY